MYRQQCEPLVITPKTAQKNPSQIAGYEPVVLNATDYSAYGESLIGREFNSTGIKYGFNGKLNDNDLGYQDYGMRLSSVKKRGFLSVDPLYKQFPWNSVYCFAENDVLRNIDLDGGEKKNIITRIFQSSDGTILTHTIEVKLHNDYNLGGGTLYTTITEKIHSENPFDLQLKESIKIVYVPEEKNIFQKVKDWCNRKAEFGFVLSGNSNGTRLDMGSHGVQFKESLDMSALLGAIGSYRNLTSPPSIGDFIKSRNFKRAYDVWDNFNNALEAGLAAARINLKDKWPNPSVENSYDIKQPVFDTVNSTNAKDVEKRNNYIKYTISSTEIKKGKSVQDPDTVRTTKYQSPE